MKLRSAYFTFRFAAVALTFTVASCGVPFRSLTDRGSLPPVSSESDVLSDILEPNSDVAGSRPMSDSLPVLPSVPPVSEAVTSSGPSAPQFTLPVTPPVTLPVTLPVTPPVTPPVTVPVTVPRLPATTQLTLPPIRPLIPVTSTVPEVTLPPAVVSGTIDRAVDGDTVDVAISGNVARVRVVGIDTPERGECGFVEATSFLAAFEGSQVVLVEAGADNSDRYGRLLRYIEVDGVDLGLQQIAAGNAVARYDSRDGYARHYREDLYVQTDSETFHRCEVGS